MPSGCVLDRETGRRSARLCTEHDPSSCTTPRWRRSSSTAAQLCEPLEHEGMAERTVIAGSMSKAYRMIGWRVGWIAGPALGGQRRRLGARVQHDRRGVRGAAGRRGGAARAAGPRGDVRRRSCSGPRRDHRGAARGRSCGPRADGRCSWRPRAVLRRRSWPPAWRRRRWPGGAGTSPRGTCGSCSRPSRSRACERSARASLQPVRGMNTPRAPLGSSARCPQLTEQGLFPRSTARCASCTPRPTRSGTTGPNSHGGSMSRSWRTARPPPVRC